eukprot:6213333-Pleurochrysis_carterae.AAC.4
MDLGKAQLCIASSGRGSGAGMPLYAPVRDIASTYVHVLQRRAHPWSRTTVRAQGDQGHEEEERREDKKVEHDRVLSRAWPLPSSFVNTHKQVGDETSWRLTCADPVPAAVPRTVGGHKPLARPLGVAHAVEALPLVATQLIQAHLQEARKTAHASGDSRVQS